MVTIVIGMTDYKLIYYPFIGAFWQFIKKNILGFKFEEIS